MNPSECNRLTVWCRPRYWEDATVNGVEDVGGLLIPFRNGTEWEVVIDLPTGRILNWPEGVAATIHYKVCDEGRYWLGTETNPRMFRYGRDETSYVPDEFLTVPGRRGYGDYIILNVDGSGRIDRYRRPTDFSGWYPVQDRSPQSSR